ncbi:protein-glutamate O-methyltransferase [Oryzomonas sagensis]|uniref:protein-glutamate O-methyltransferase n=1 Tax=Oryzomonas sagensis TaxID=2603857 RepID=A0ABQ6TLS3_9BACT|nr:protein-glutamate O-methyltransferase [Oryzomonas sagensis]KAB0669399.1 protein-glutamate O-methyltransferase [Oryzomonas sagensis]
MNPHDEAFHTPGIPAVLKDREFNRFSGFIYDEVGIKMPAAKKTMLEARLQKRLKALGMRTFEEYAEHVFSGAEKSSELIHLIDVVTTNKTDFFREPAHFDYLVKSALPALVEAREAGYRSPLKIWSAGCSSGEEPYTLTMVLSEFMANNPGFRVSILATDISTAVLEKAKNAIYTEDRVDPIPLQMKKKYLLRSRDKSKGLVRVAPHLRSLVQFRRLNFMEDFGMREQMEIIFCRNVIIYFDKPTQERLLNKFCRQLVPGGYLFLGHSETLSGLNVPLTPVASTVYRKL